jgi:hypothetical protein
MEDAPAGWRVCFSGFLEKKSVLGTWDYRWVVLDNNRLFVYLDETEKVLKQKISITSSTTIEAGQSEGSRGYVFHILDPSISDNVLIIFCSPDFCSLEAWMIAVIQSSNGEYRTSENFCVGSSSDTRSSLILPSSGGMSTKFSLSVSPINQNHERTGYLMKQGSKIKTWKRRWFQLKDNHFRYYEFESESLKGFRFIDDESKVILLPADFEGQSYGFSFVTLDSLSGQYCLLRLSASTEEEMYDWISALRSAIQLYTDDKFSIPIHDIDDEERETRDSEDEEEERLLGISSDQSNNERGRRCTQSVLYVDCPLICVSPEESLAALTADNDRSVYYLNDETVWAKLARKMSPSIHTPSNYDLQRFYLIHFCALIPGTNYILVEVFEHQRYLPIKGWSCLNLLFSDCAKLANCIGVKYPDRYLRRADPPLDYSWVEEKPLEEYGANVSEYGIKTPWKWTACRAFTAEGEKAWSYGTNFDDLRKKYETEVLRIQSHTTQRAVDVVRRRRWIRLAVENSPPTDS